MSEAKPIIGLSGGIGSGKSTIARLMAGEGGYVIDADALAREALNRPEVLQQLQAWWGPEVIDTSGRADRRRIAERVFSDPAQRKRLEELIHPLVGTERQRRIVQAQADPAVRFIVLDVPLLFEVGLDRICDRVVFIDAPEAVRQQRVKATRGWDDEELTRREENQISLDRKRKLADDIIVNDTSEAGSLEQVRNLLSRLLAKT